MIRQLVLSLVLLCPARASLGQTADRQPSREATQTQLRPPGEGRLQILTSRGGMVGIGRITEVRDGLVFFDQHPGGRAVFRVADIRRVEEVPASSVKDGEYWHPNPSGTRLFFAPTGRTLRRGEGYFSDTMLLLPSAAYGFTDRLSLAGGMSLVPGIGANQLIYLIPRVAIISKRNTSVAAGALLLTQASWWRDRDQGDVIGGWHAAATLGGPYRSVTAGVAVGLPNSRAALMLGGEYRLTSRLMLVTENWLVGQSEPITSIGVRMLNEKVSTTFGVYRVGAGGDSVAIPYLDFTIRR
ncbi:MAG: hypothetical protein HY321_09115 [Armatimonadetes bacterium]|nr:hypothetical protein [Armatimonadota bacterium]